VNYKLVLYPGGAGELFFRSESIAFWNNLKEGIDRFMERLELK
jgi:hypothetical protein